MADSNGYSQQLELQRETIFKDAVLAGAEAKAKAIVKKAKKAAKQEIEAAYRACEQADYDTIAATYELDNRREDGALRFDAHRELLEYRAGLVGEVFGTVEEKLSAFKKTAAYEALLVRRLQAYSGKLSGPATVYLRREDMGLSTALEKALPGSVCKALGSIRLGGFKVGDKKRLYDETFDAALLLEKQRFYDESGLGL